MSVSLGLISELERAVADKAARQRADILRHVTDLFIVGAGNFSDPEIELFDDVIERLAADIEVSALALLAERLAPITNAPPRTIRRLAFDDDLDVATPVLSQSQRLDEPTLIENARSKSQGHLLAISRRRDIPEAVTDVLAERGDKMVLLSALGNKGARFSEKGFSVVLVRSDRDEEIVTELGGRRDLPTALFRKLIAEASEKIREKLATTYPERAGEIHAVVEIASRRLTAEIAAEATRASNRSENPDKLSAALTEVKDLDTMVETLAKQSALPRHFIEQAVKERRSETLLIVARALGLPGTTVKEILRLRARAQLIRQGDIVPCLGIYGRINPATAREILAFYRMRETQLPAPDWKLPG